MNIYKIQVHKGKYKMSDAEKEILVLGVGNILFTDEGIGVNTVSKLEEIYTFSDNVTLMDGGTLGSKLIDPIMSCDFLIVVDAVLGGKEPGTIYRLTGDDMRKSMGFKNSLHDTDLVDTLLTCDLMGKRPETVVVGIEPVDFETLNTGVSPQLAARMDDIMRAVLQEITELGATYSKK